MALCNLAQVKDYLGIVDDNDDALIERLILAAQDRMEREAERSPGGFESQEFVEQVDGSDTDNLVVKNTPITAVSKIDFILHGGSKTEVDSDSYRFSENEIRIIISRRDVARLVRTANVGVEFGHTDAFDLGFQNYEVTYTGGYDPVPAGLVQGCIDVVAIMYRGRSTDTSMQSETIGDYSYTRKADEQVRMAIADAIAPYRRVTL